MDSVQVWLTISLSILSVVLIPLLVVLVRVVQKATRLEVKQEQIADSLVSLVRDKDKVHAAILDQMKEDRRVANARLRWLEEYIWKGKP